QTAQSSARLDAENRRKYPQEILYPTGKGKTADDYALIPREDFKRTNPAVPGHTYRDELRTGSSDYRDMPLDATTPSKPQAGGSGEVLEQTPSKPQAGGSDEHTGSLYPVWIAAVKCGECRPSVDETWKWIQKRIAPKETGSKTNDRTRIGKMQKAFFVRAIREGLMQVNPVYRNGGKKYIWRGTHA
ncbi:hypothetical protein, partial [Thiothrix sp.]|uniref:hypothetical protein n=1 Tax=Thiothrix sp. TaxID=1032 RepID=UPI00257B4FF9